MPAFRLIELDPGALDALEAPLSAMLEGALGGLLIRGAFDAAALSAAADRLDAFPAERRRLSAESDIEFVGAPLQWAGPSLGAYLEAARAAERACDAHLPGFRRGLRAWLERVARAAVSTAAGPEGTYAPLTLRRIPPGEEVGPHFELGQLEAPSYASLREELGGPTVLSFYVVLRAPDRGGELGVYDLAWGDPGSADVKSHLPFDGPLLGRFEPTLIPPRGGDLLVFDSGRHAHRVLPVRGDRARWTAGGLLGVARSGALLSWA